MLIVSGRDSTCAPASRGLLDVRACGGRPGAGDTGGCRNFVVAADPIEPDRVNVYEEWESEEALVTFRRDGQGDDVSSSIVRADVARHVVTSCRSCLAGDGTRVKECGSLQGGRSAQTRPAAPDAHGSGGEAVLACRTHRCPDGLCAGEADGMDTDLDPDCCTKNC